MEIKRSGSQPSGKGPADYFTGAVRHLAEPLTLTTLRLFSSSFRLRILPRDYWPQRHFVSEPAVCFRHIQCELPSKVAHSCRRCLNEEAPYRACCSWPGSQLHDADFRRAKNEG